MKLQKLIILIAIFAFPGIFVNGQGCSDAGVCTSGIMSETGNENTNAFDISLGFHFAQGDASTNINSILLEAAYFINPSSFIQAKIPYQMISGKLAKTSGVGDITISINRRFINENGHTVDGFLGTRIASGKADFTENGLPLPMVYQTSLGTTDLLIGGKWSYKGWIASLGYQQPLAQNNENGFLESLWGDNDDANNYHDSKNIERSGDLVVRLEKTIPAGNFSFTGGLVPIYHLSEDSYLNENNERVDIAGSDGLTLNLALSGNYNLNENVYISAFYGMPLVTRDVQPAGLARKYAAGISAGFRF